MNDPHTEKLLSAVRLTTPPGARGTGVPGPSARFERFRLTYPLGNGGRVLLRRRRGPGDRARRQALGIFPRASGCQDRR